MTHTPISPILVVEDSTTQLLLLKGTLEKAGYGVTLAKNGEEGLKSIALAEPSMIISDIRMPIMDGYEMCWRIKNDPKTRHIPVILLSGLSETEDILLGLEAMADSYIIKPFEEAEILFTVADLYQKRNSLIPPDPPLTYVLHDHEYSIRSNRNQILNFLVSIYDNMVRRNTQLEEIQTQLRIINEQLTERTQDLEASENRFRSLVQTVPDIIYRIDEQGSFIFVNHSIRKLGYEPDELIGKHFSLLIAPDEVERVSRNKVLPRFLGHAQGDRPAPKLFDEKRTGLRRTSGLEVRLTPNVNKKTEEEASMLFGELHCFEVNSAGIYQVNRNTRQDHFVGTVGVIRDITERKQIAEALTRAKEEAILANKAKSEFLSRMSHELRTPLNAVIGFSQLLEHNPLEPLTGNQKESVIQIFSSGRHLLELINGLLDVARIESGKIAPEMEVLDPKPIVQNCIAMTRPLALKRFVSLTNTSEERPFSWIYADPLRLKQVLINLLSNAVKFNRKGGYVTISHRITQENRLEISISDTGSGIPKEEWSQVFKPFNRFGAEAAGIEGTGIGLNISKGLVEMMNGTIGFDSEMGKGSRFWISFPIANHSLCQRSETIPPSPQTAEFSGPRILLYVEDNPSNAHLMQEIINRMPQLKLLHAKNAEEGIELAKNHTPDLVIMDIQLPGMDGFQALSRLNELPETSTIPAIALSGFASPEDIERGKQAGFLRYLTKPLILSELQETLKEILGPGLPNE
ncbi:MAG: response regulator [Magnetococcales bacterium]|nr:response regulator [Magnetococcales bacterium]